MLAASKLSDGIFGIKLFVSVDIDAVCILTEALHKAICCLIIIQLSGHVSLNQL